MQDLRWRFWIDVGGTFTDCLALSPDGTEHALKIISSGIVKSTGDLPPGSDFILDEHEIDAELPAPALAMHLLTRTPISNRLPTCEVYLGTTKGTNALLTRTGARTALIASTGFRDFLTIGNQTRPELFALSIRKVGPLFETAIEIGERVLFDGTVEIAVEAASVRAQLMQLKQAGIESIAICLMHAWRFPRHEQIVAAIAREVGFDDVRLSSEVAPLIKIVPRGETTVLDAYLNPVIDRYLNRIVESIGVGSKLRLMTSAGNLATRSRFSGKDSVLSGPAGGVVGAAMVARQAGIKNAIGFDMGGTSTDVSRYDGEFEIEYEARKAGVNIVTPMMAIETVAAGGGSICRFDGTRLTVGPESAGAYPGPACYGRGGPVTVTDINLLLGRLDGRQFPFRLDSRVVESGVEDIRNAMNDSGIHRTPVEIALGFLQIANHNMANAIRTVSVAKGFDPREHVLIAFGGAGGQHCCGVADNLDIRQILIHPRASYLSALGIRLAEHSSSRTLAVLQPWTAGQMERLRSWAAEGIAELSKEMIDEGCDAQSISGSLTLELRYSGTDQGIPVREPADGDFTAEFARIHRRLYGYEQNRPLEIVAARVVASSINQSLPVTAEFQLQRIIAPNEFRTMYSNGQAHRVGCVDWRQLVPGDRVVGPAAISDPSTSTVVDDGWRADVLQHHQLLLTRGEAQVDPRATVHQEGSAGRVGVVAAEPTWKIEPDPVELEVFNGSFRAIAQQMGTVLQKTSVSVNVRERLDFSCALFSHDGDLVVNAPHIPVHLGAMSESVRATIALNPVIHPGDVFVTNDPFAGGSHLPDITVLTPVFQPEFEMPSMWVASRSHHAEIGGIAPGSMPAAATRLSEEGVLIQNFKLIDRGVERFSALRSLLLNAVFPSRNPDENIADVAAQVAANRAGINAMQALIDRHSFEKVSAYIQHVRDAAGRKTCAALAQLSDGEFNFVDCMDDGTRVQVSIRKQQDTLDVDFGGTSAVHPGNLNANRAIVTSALIYVLRCLIAEDIPLNEGVLAPVSLVLPECFLNSRPGLTPDESPAVVGGNVETSQRIVDVLLGALGAAAASQGTMNNWLIGDDTFGYYETVGGGSGATAVHCGADAVHCHMSNTRLTDPEVLESRYPIVLREFAVRRGSGGKGRHRGGDGMIREMEFRAALTLSILSSRRTTQPFGLMGGSSGAAGENRLIQCDGRSEILPSQCQRQVKSGDRLRLATPGGGGYGLGASGRDQSSSP